MEDRSSRTTWMAIGIAVAITIPYIGILIQTIREILRPGLVSREELRELTGLGASLTTGDDAGIALTFIAVALGSISGIVIMVILGLIARRQWAREAAFAVFGALGLTSGALGLSGMFSTPRPSGSWLGVATGAGCGAVVALLLLETTGMDFELAEMSRHRRRAER